MALAYALHHIESNNLARLTNYGEYLERHRPTHEAEIWERTAWSCVHGVERWNINCGCNSGGYANWNQEWRTPLRQAFDWLRDRAAARFEENGRAIFKDPWQARNDYINVILNRWPDSKEKFFKEHTTHELNQEERITALKLMEMQRHAMLMYTSCGWFFDELSGIETTQVIQYAARTIQLYEDIFGEPLEPMFLDRLELAKSNIPEHKDGRVIYDKFVRPAMVDRQKVAAHYALMSLFENYAEETKVHCYKVQTEDLTGVEAGRSKLIVGRARITSEVTEESDVFTFGSLYMGDHFMNAGVRAYQGKEKYKALKQDLTDPFNSADFPEVIRLLDKHFAESTYSLRSIFHDDQRKILNIIMQSTLTEAEAAYRQIYETHAPMMRFVSDLRVPLPRAFSMAAEFALNSSLRSALEDSDNLDFTRINALLDEAHANNVTLDDTTLGFALRKTIKRLSQQFLENSDNVELMKKLEAAAGLARSLPFEVNVWRSQNNFYQMLHKICPAWLERALANDPIAREWVEHFVALGRNLSVKIEPPALPELRKVS